MGRKTEIVATAILAAQALDEPQELEGDRILAVLEHSGALGRGKAHVMSIRAVREALGSYWDERRSAIWDLTEVFIRRRIGGGDLCARLNEDAFLIVTYDLEPDAAKVLTIGILRDVTTRFLGQMQACDVAILEVRGYRDNRLDCRTLRETEVERVFALECATPEMGRGPDASATPPDIDSDVRDDQLTTLEGRRLRCSVSVSATIDLSQLAVAGHRIEPKINIEGTDELLPAEARRAFLPRDTLKVDLLVLQRGLARLEGRQRPAERPSLILTVSFLTLSNGNTRNALLDEIERARDAVTKGVIFEVSDFDDGVPAGRLMEIAALLKPFCRSVFARAGQTRASARSLRSLGFSGIVLDSPPATATDVDQSLWLLSMSAGLQGLKGAAIAANLTSTRVLPMAAEAGFTHATVKM